MEIQGTESLVSMCSSMKDNSFQLLALRALGSDPCMFIIRIFEVLFGVGLALSDLVECIGWVRFVLEARSRGDDLRSACVVELHT